MNELLLLMIESPTIWLFILAIVILLFGGSRLPQLAKALGQSKRAFREGHEEAEEGARVKQLNRAESGGATKPLDSIDDEALFEEARRRAARLRAAEVSNTEK